MIDIYPAIDIYNGKAVFLTQGRLEDIKVYGDPLNYALKFAEKFNRMHIVDLNGAFTGRPENLSIIEKIIRETGVFVQVGGGFRTLNDINNALLIGAGSVIIGTKIMDSGFINSINTDFITASMDVIDGNIAINGWKNISNNYIDVYLSLKNKIKRFIYTSIKSDGVFKIDFNKKFWGDEYFIYAGGVSTMEDVKFLEKKGFSGVIVGKAIYEGVFKC